MNTKISYLYRDGSNYKMPNEAVIAGIITKQQIAVIMNCLDCGEYFIPGQVGLPEKRFGEWTEDDHCWFELGMDGFETTEAEPDVDITSDEMVEKFLEAKGNWKENENGHGEEYARRFEQSLVCIVGKTG